jgi:hypothetical protein
VDLPRRIGPAVITALVLVGASSFLTAAVDRGAARSTAGRVGASIATPAQLVASSGKATPMSCADLPVSSALLDPQSCWLTGAVSALLVGSAPGQAGEGAIVIVRGQGQNLIQLAGSGALQVTQINGQSACVQDAQQEYRAVDLVAGTVASTWSSGCSLSTGKGALANPALTAPSSSISSSPPPSELSNSASLLAPSVTPSYYEYYSYYSACHGNPTGSCPLYQQGASTHTTLQNGLVVLDFGSPCYVPSDPSVYGVEMFFQPTCIPAADLRPLVENWISGYESQNQTASANLTVALGTSNSYNGVDSNYALTDQEMTSSGQSWYQNLVGAIPTAGLAAPLTIWGGDDIEQSSDNEWYPGTPTVAWVQGFGSVSPAAAACPLNQGGYLADYGDDVLGGSGSADGWTVQQVYDVAWGLPVTCAEPEIYYADLATEWQQLSQWAVQNGNSAISFSGVMTEVEAGTLDPNDAWVDLEVDTGQTPAIPTVTTISWTLQNLPVVSSVAPEQGPVAGGTQVAISGSNLGGALAVDFGSTAASSVTVNGDGSLSATAPANSAGFVDVTVQTIVGTSAPSGADGFIYTTAGAYHPLTPSRIADTRPGSNFPDSGQAPGPGQTLDVQVAGEGGVPSTGVAAVVVNVTVTGATVGGYVSAYPTGLAVPNTSTIDFAAGQTEPNLAEVALGRAGQISIYNLLGTTQLIVDVEGWYDSAAPASGAGLFNSLSPQRIVDTRPGTGTPYSGETLGPGQSLAVQVSGVGGVPSSGAEAVVLNVTEADATTPGFLTVYPDGAAQPTTSNLNWIPGGAVPNQDVVELGAGGQMMITNGPGSVDVIVDVAGWYSDGASGATTGLVYHPDATVRALDTRSASGISAGQTLAVDMVGLPGIPATGASAVVMNVTITGDAGGGFLQVWPEGGTQTTTSELNWVAGQTTENLVVMGLGSAGTINFANFSSSTLQLVLDVSGWFGSS